MTSSKEDIALKVYEMLVSGVEAIGGTRADIDRLATDDSKKERWSLAVELAGSAGFFEIDVNYGESEEEYANRFRTLAAKCCSWKDPDPDATPEHFPSGGRRGVHRRRVHILYRLGREEREENIRAIDLEENLATILSGKVQAHPYDVLTLCVKSRHLYHSRFLVASIQESWQGSDGRRRVLAVGTYLGMQEVGLYCFESRTGDDPWPGLCALVAVSEVLVL